MQVIPYMAQKRDVLAIAPTGSGKTAAFILPLIKCLGTSRKNHCRAIIVSPTRELANQIHRETQRLIHNCQGLTSMVLNSTNYTMLSTKSNKKGAFHCDILITTPHRFISLLDETSQSPCLSAKGPIEWLILDEVDKLLESGFISDIDKIVSFCQSTNQLLHQAWFSATLPNDIENMAVQCLRDPVRIIVGIRNISNTSVKQELMFVGSEEGKLLAVRQLLKKEGIKPPILIFLQSKERAKELYRELVYDNVHCDVIHADRTEVQRHAIVQSFRQGKLWVLICTDLMGRGIDFKGINCVINVDMPTSLASYIHRIGRTGRAGQTGRAVTLFTENETDVSLLRSIGHAITESGNTIPEWIHKLAKRKKSRVVKTPKRKTLDTTPQFIRKRSKK